MFHACAEPPVDDDIGVSDHFLVWLELGRVAKSCRKQKRTIRKWRLDRFAEDGVKGKYCQALRAEVESFSDSIQEKVVQGMRGRELVSEVLEDWESIVNRVAKAEVEEKVVVCGRAARWWDDEIKAKIEQRRELYKRILRGEDGLWEEYVRLRKEVKQLVTEKKLQIWNEVVDKANSDYEGNKKEFWAFVGRRTKGKKKGIVALRNSAGVSVTSTKGKLEVLKTHYRHLGSCSVDSAFDDSWKEEVDEQVSECSSVSKACEDRVLDREIEREEIAVCVRKLKNNKTGGSDGLVGELLKYGGSGMIDLLQQLFAVVWREEFVPPQWREGLIVNLFKKGDKEDPGNYRGITLLSVVGKVFCKVLNNRLVQHFDKGGVLHEGQAGFRLKRSCVDNIYTLNELVQGRMKEGKRTFAFFLDVQKAYDTVWRNGLWLKLWEHGVQGKMWRVIKGMYESSRSAVLLEGEKSEVFDVEQGVAQGCSLSPILFSVFINGLLVAVEQAGLGIELSDGGRVGGLLFADDFVGVSESGEQLQRVIDVVHSYCRKWRLKANVTKSAVMTFGKGSVEGSWKWGEQDLPRVSKYTYLGIDFAESGAWDVHIKKVVASGKKKVNQLNSVISNRDINLSARRLLLLAVVRPTLEYGSEVWEANKAQASSLESVVLGGAKRILGCSSRTCNEAVRGDMGLESLQGRRDKAKLKWWYKLACMEGNRYPQKLFRQVWNIKPRRGRQRKSWSRVVDDLFSSLDLDKAEWVEGIQKGECSLKGFLSVVGESIDERESRKFKEGLDSKVKLSLYRTFCKAVEFKAYLHGECDTGSRLMFKFRSGTHGLNEELGRHRGREGRKECLLCDDECESVSHVLWDCPVYNTLRNDFLCKLQELLGDGFENFESLDSFEKASFVLGSELWEDDFSSMLDLVKDYIVDVWELRKARLYDENLSVPQSQCQNASGELGDVGGGGRLRCLHGKVDTTISCMCTCSVGSAQCSGCVVYGPGAMAAI